MSRRTIHLEIGRIAFTGVDPGNQRRFERAFAAACEAELRDTEPRGAVRERAWLEVSFEPTASPEALAHELARAVVSLVGER